MFVKPSPNAGCSQGNAMQPLRGRPLLWGLFFAAYALHNTCMRYPYWLGAPHDLTHIAGLFVPLCAMAVVWKPQARWPVTSLCACWLLWLATRFPTRMNNHETVTLVMCFAYTVSALWPRDGKLPSREQTFDLFAPVAGWLLLVMYFYVAFHKINRDFLAAETSCAWQMYLNIATWTPLPNSPSIAPLVIYGVLLTEAGLPLLLLLPRTRTWALGLGTLFHFSLALHSNIWVEDFSMLVLSLYVLLLSESQVRRAHGAAVAFRERMLGWSFPRLQATLLVGCAAIAVLVGATALLLGGIEWIDNLPPQMKHGPHRIGYSVLVAVLLGILALNLRPGNSAAAAQSNAQMSREHNELLRPNLHPNLAAPLILFFIGLMPYLGLSTDNVLAMFSNARFGRQQNHLLLDDQLRLFDYLDQWAELVEIAPSDYTMSDDQEYRTLPVAGWRAQFALAKHPPAWATFMTPQGQVTWHRDVNPTPSVFQDPAGLERLLYFHWMPTLDRRARCEH